VDFGERERFFNQDRQSVTSTANLFSALFVEGCEWCKRNTVVAALRQ
jgi:hypothetical protein